MTQEELVRELAERAETTHALVNRILEDLGHIIGEQTLAGNHVKHRAIGKFEPKIRAAGKVRHPRTGAEIQIAAKRSVKFETSKSLCDWFNEPQAQFNNLVRETNGWASTRLDGVARMSAWEVLDEAERVGARSGMTLAARKSFDALVTAYRDYAEEETR